MKTKIRVMFVLIAILVTSSNAAAQVYRVRVIAESSEGQDVVNAVKAQLRATSRYVVTDEPKVDFTLNVECALLTPSHGYVCSSTAIFWGPPIFPLPAPMSEYSLVKGPNAASVADAITQNFVSNTTEENISLLVRSMHNWVALFCKNPVKKNYCEP